MKNFLIAGNWKMNTSPKDAKKLAENIVASLPERTSGVDVLVCPPFIDLSVVNSEIEKSYIKLGAQNCYYENAGAYTGEISPKMLVDSNCEFVIIGHSERRTLFGETDRIVNTKIRAALNADLKVIMCIGETLNERNGNTTFEVLARQIEHGLTDIETWKNENIVVAYEPIWAIGTGLAANLEQIEEAHDFIKSKLIDVLGDSGKDCLILYGGSVNAKNAADILKIESVYGALIGGASLKADQFVQIIKFAQEAKK